MSHKKLAGFNRRVVKAAGESWGNVRQYNFALRRLDKRRATRVEKTGPLAESKIAWKAAVLQQALLYRTIELGGGCARAWNFENVLCSVLAARALLETIAVTVDVEAKLQKHYDSNDFGALDDLITSHTFATRDQEMIAENPIMGAKSVLTYIDRLDKMIPGIRPHYDSLSEWCHPNCYGHYLTFATLNKNTGTVSFSKRKMHGKGLLNHILAVYSLMRLVEEVMNRLDVLVLKISQAHAAAFPVGWTGKPHR